MLKELRHSVKQKNPDTEKRIKIPTRNKGGDSPPHTRLAKARHHQGNAAKLLGLTYHQFRALYRRAPGRSLTQQLGGLGGDVRLPHEGGADEDGLGAARLQSHDVGPGVDAALGDE